MLLSSAPPRGAGATTKRRPRATEMLRTPSWPSTAIEPACSSSSSGVGVGVLDCDVHLGRQAAFDEPYCVHDRFGGPFDGERQDHHVDGAGAALGRLRRCELQAVGIGEHRGGAYRE